MRQHLGQDVVDPDFPRDRLGGGAVIAGEHPNLEPERLELGDRVGRLRLERVRDRDQPGGLSADCEVHRGRALAGDLLRPLDAAVEPDPEALHERPVAHHDLEPLDLGLDALAGDRLERARRRQVEPELLRAGHDRLRERVLGANLGRRAGVLDPVGDDQDSEGDAVPSGQHDGAAGS